MFNSAKDAMGCPAYRARLEDSLSGGEVRLDAGAELRAHLLECPRCREALDAARLASELVRGARSAVPQPSQGFVTRVMAAIREEERRVGAPSNIWRPLELLARRFAVAAAVVLLALFVYMAEFGPARGTYVVPPAPQTAVRVDFPQPPAAPSTPDDVLMSMAERGHGI